MNIEQKNAILRARGSNLKNEPLRFQHAVDDAPQVHRPIDKLVYQPNVFGWPCNDIDVMNNTTNPEVKIALERRNLKMAAEYGVEDDDVALDVMQRNDETSDQYFDRMQPLIEDAKNDLKKKSK